MAGYYFNLPQITDLTIPQQAALDDLGQIALSGGPGTGKSVVSLWRHISNYISNPAKRSLLLTYTTTLKEYLKACCRSQNEDAAKMVATSINSRYKIHNCKFAEIIIDEAQDLDEEYYHGILSKVSYGADDSQILYPDHCCCQSQLTSLFPDNVEHVLSKNFRNTQRIMKFAKATFPNAVIPREIIDGLASNVGELPVFMVSNGSSYDRTNDKQNNAILEIINTFKSDTHNIAILVPWKSDVQVFENILKEKIDDFSLYYENRVRFPDGCAAIKNVHITTFKSAKGLEFDTVIIPNFDILERLPRIVQDKDTGENKIICDWQDLYVACTRAKSNLYLISNYDMPRLNAVVDKTVL
ncbi:3'-5' exonuclease [Parabacteroides sp. ZJ-118]|uniref:3'-5' exonuclease n=1 Tax=Parabacteroides sp. ZJ-118 TaxID=2709398 RepID=UPI0013EC3155|nr:3'-5' exonuclease [Parabacteroides sp. ZJ-118]